MARPEGRAAESLGALAVERAGAGGDRPFVTFSDLETGERTELGHATFANWVAKTANLLVADLALPAGSRIALRVGGHWAGAVTAVAAWRAGLVVDVARAAAAAAAVVREDLEPPEAAELLVVGRGLGARCAAPPAVGEPFADEVLAQADDFAGPPVAADAPALAAPAQRGVATVSHRDLLAAGRTVVDRLGLGPGDRLLSSLPCDRLDGVVAGPVAALVAGAPLVLFRPTRTTGAPALWEHAAAERCTHAVLAGAPAEPPPAALTAATCTVTAGPDRLAVAVTLV